MEKVLYFLSVNMTTVVMVLIAILIVILFILTVYDLVIKNREKAAREEYELELSQMSLEQAEETEEAQTENLDNTTPIKVIKYVEEDPELEKTQAKLELANLKEELAKKEAAEKLAKEQAEAEVQLKEKEKQEEKTFEEEKKPEVFSPIGIDIKKEKREADDVIETLAHESEIEAYEAQQEEDAIISIDELNKVKEFRDGENIRLEEDTSIPISIDELYQTAKLPKVELSDFNTIEEDRAAEQLIEKKKPEKETLAVKSHLFSRLDDEIDLSNDNDLSPDQVHEETLKTGEFLARLKELKSKLN